MGMCVCVVGVCECEYWKRRPWIGNEWIIDVRATENSIIYADAVS